MRARGSLAAGAAGLALLAGCAAPAGPAGPSRAPGFDPVAVRRPAVLIVVSLERAGMGSEPFSDRERAVIPERYQAAVQHALDALGILPVEVALEARRAQRPLGRPLERLDVARALRRAREVGADSLVVVDARLGRRHLVHCREARRPVAGPTTFWLAGLAVHRLPDGAALLTDPGAAAPEIVDVELDCGTGRLLRRRGMDELAEGSAARVLAPLR